jgi:hypothetical protein
VTLLWKNTRGVKSPLTVQRLSTARRAKCTNRPQTAYSVIHVSGRQVPTRSAKASRNGGATQASKRMRVIRIAVVAVITWDGIWAWRNVSGAATRGLSPILPRPFGNRKAQRKLSLGPRHVPAGPATPYKACLRCGAQQVPTRCWPSTL